MRGFFDDLVGLVGLVGGIDGKKRGRAAFGFPFVQRFFSYTHPFPPVLLLPVKCEEHRFRRIFGSGAASKSDLLMC